MALLYDATEARDRRLKMLLDTANNLQQNSIMQQRNQIDVAKFLQDQKDSVQKNALTEQGQFLGQGMLPTSRQSVMNMPPQDRMQYLTKNTTPGLTGRLYDTTNQKGVTDNQDKLEKQYADRLSKAVSFRSGGLGLQDQKVNQAIDIRTMADQFYNPKTDTYNIPPSMQTELVLGLARLISPTGQVGVQLESELAQATARQDWAKLAIYFGADPHQVGGSTQSVIKTFLDSVDRQGLTAEKLRDQYVSGLKDLVPTGLKEDRVKRLQQAELTSSYSKHLNNSPSSQFQVFDVGGKTYRIPKDQVDAFKKAKGIK